jgi:hypothetical protein
VRRRFFVASPQFIAGRVGVFCQVRRGSLLGLLALVAKCAGFRGRGRWRFLPKIPGLMAGFVGPVARRSRS